MVLPADALPQRDFVALNAELSDPRFKDEQALAKYGLDFVTDRHLPEKLGELGLMR